MFRFPPTLLTNQLFFSLFVRWSHAGCLDCGDIKPQIPSTMVVFKRRAAATLLPTASAARRLGLDKRIRSTVKTDVGVRAQPSPHSNALTQLFPSSYEFAWVVRPVFPAVVDEGGHIDALTPRSISPERAAPLIPVLLLNPFFSLPFS